MAQFVYKKVIEPISGSNAAKLLSGLSLATSTLLPDVFKKYKYSKLKYDFLFTVRFPSLKIFYEITVKMSLCLPYNLSRYNFEKMAKNGDQFLDKKH